MFPWPELPTAPSSPTLIHGRSPSLLGAFPPAELHLPWKLQPAESLSPSRFPCARGSLPSPTLPPSTSLSLCLPLADRVPLESPRRAPKLCSVPTARISAGAHGRARLLAPTMVAGSLLLHSMPRAAPTRSIFSSRALLHRRVPPAPLKPLPLPSTRRPRPTEIFPAARSFPCFSAPRQASAPTRPARPVCAPHSLVVAFYFLIAHTAFRRPSPYAVLLCTQSRPSAGLWPPSCLGLVHPPLFGLDKNSGRSNPASTKSSVPAVVGCLVVPLRAVQQHVLYLCSWLILSFLLPFLLVRTKNE